MCCRISVHAQEQGKRSIRIAVVNEQKNALPGSTVYLLNADSVVIHSRASNASGIIEFTHLNTGKYRVKASEAGYENGYSPLIDLEKDTTFSGTITLKPKSRLLQDVTVVSKRPAIQFLPD